MGNLVSGLISPKGSGSLQPSRNDQICDLPDWILETFQSNSQIENKPKAGNGMTGTWGTQPLNWIRVPESRIQTILIFDDSPA